GIRDKLVTGVQTCALPISIGAHTETPIRPPGLSTRFISAKALGRSEKNCEPCWQVITSKVASPARSASAGQSVQSMRAWPPNERSEERRVGKSGGRGGGRM